MTTTTASHKATLRTAILLAGCAVLAFAAGCSSQDAQDEAYARSRAEAAKKKVQLGGVGGAPQQGQAPAQAGPSSRPAGASAQ